MERMRRLVRTSVRVLRKDTILAMSLVLSIALGIGIGFPILALFRSIALRSGPYTNPILPGGPIATAWLPGSPVDPTSIPETQDDGLRVLAGVLLGLTTLLLAIALINVVALQLARASQRRGEVALRAVLGATRRDLASELLAEATPLISLGIGAGLIVSGAVIGVTSGSWPDDVAPWPEYVLDEWLVLSVTVMFVAVLLLAWLSPITVAWRKDLRRYLTTGGRSTAGGAEVATRQGLVMAQIAASIVVLTCAGLLLRGFAFSDSDPRELGFDPRDTLTVQISLPPSPSMSPGEEGLIYERIRDRIATLPGVVDTSVASPGTWVGLGTTDRVSAVCLECWSYIITPASWGDARIHSVSPGFFAAVGATISRGRDLGRNDSEDSPRMAVVNHMFAGWLFPNGDPLGKSIQVGGLTGEWFTVVGVVEEMSAPGIGMGAEPIPAVYLSTLDHAPSIVNLAVRATDDPMRLLPAVAAAVRAEAPRATLANAMTMERYLARFRAPLRWFALLFGSLAGVALVLAATGLYSLTAYNVSRRTREIGVRMAVGATRRDIMRMILGQSLRITGIGAVLSLFGALSLARILQVLLGRVEPFDPALFGGVVTLLVGVSLLASYRPALRAASVEPQISLRQD